MLVLAESLLCCAHYVVTICYAAAAATVVLQELCKEVPGLFSLGPKGQLVVGEARQHEMQLEKVRLFFNRMVLEGCREVLGGGGGLVGKKAGV